MSADPDTRLLRVARHVAEGRDVDWERERRRADGSESTLRGLQRLASIQAAFARVFEGASGGDDRPAVGVPFQWGHLEVRERLGGGTFAEVFRAYDPLLDREVALKLLHGDVSEQSGWLEEARRLARVRHPNVVVIHGVDVHNDRAGFWTDLVRGVTLEERLEASGRAGVEEACQVGIELCRALAAIHAAGIVHGDIKAANVLREIGGRVVLTDFGAAGEVRVTRAPSTVGTPLAMAPELFEGACPTPASDIYALGVLLFRFVTGCYPVEAESLEALQELLARSVHAGSPDFQSRLPGPLGEALDRALEPDAQRRVQHARDLERLLIAALTAHQSGVADGAPLAVGDDSPVTDRLLGREAELGTLQAEYMRSRMGTGFPVIVHGDPGVGKSYLARHFQAWAEGQGALALYVRFFEEDAGLRSPDEIFGDWLEVIEHEEAKRVPDGQRRGGTSAPEHVRAPPESLGQALIGLSRQRPLVLIFDDLQWATRACRDVIGNLMRNGDGEALMVLGLGREEAFTQADHPMADWLAHQAANRRFTALPLEPFDRTRFEAALQTLVPGPAGTSAIPAAAMDRLYQLSGGNPYFLVELLRLLTSRGVLVREQGPVPGWRWRDTGEWRLPDSLVMATRARLSALPEPVLHALQGAAVLGDEFDLDTIQGMLQVSQADAGSLLEQAVRVGVLTHRGLSPGADYGFRHALVRHVIIEDLTPVRRRHLHAAAAQALMAAKPENDPSLPAALSWHYEAAADPERTVTWSLAAWRQARSRGQWSEALTLLERARRALEQSDADGLMAALWLELELGHAEAAWHLGQLARSRLCSEAALARARAAGKSALEARALLQQARTGIALGQYRFAEGEADAAVDRYFELGDHEGVSRARLYLAEARIAMGNYRSAARVVRKITEHCAENATVDGAHALLGWALALQGRFEEAVLHLRRAITSAERRGDARELTVNLRRLHWVHLSCGEFGEAYELARHAYELARRADDAFDEAKALMGMGQSRLGQGLCGEAIAYLRLTLDKLEQMGDSHCQAETLWLLGRAHCECGRLDTARDLLQRALAMVREIGDRDDEFRFLADLARVELAAGRPDAALSHLTPALEIAGELGSRDGLGTCRAERTLALLALARTPEALADARSAVELLEKSTSAERWRGHWALARALRAGGNADDAAELAALKCCVDLLAAIRAQIPARDRLRRREITLLRSQPARELVELLARAGQAERAAAVAHAWELPYHPATGPETPRTRGTRGPSAPAEGDAS